MGAFDLRADACDHTHYTQFVKSELMQKSNGIMKSPQIVQREREREEKKLYAPN